ncbi:MAG TPA: glutamate ABC transporter substrate-binding protein [Propionibacteriaceae bacterium]|nr:glutamate ABC transporter substrate-binding protein [Propionibacteriaceae bacterium]
MNAIPTLTRRGILSLSLGAGLVLTGCAKNSGGSGSSSASGSGAPKASKVDAAAFDKIVTSGPVAQDADIAASPWAKKIKDAGVLRWGGTNTSTIFSLLDPATGRLLGFDAGMVDLLGHYILGGSDVSKLAKLSQTSVDTRETMLQNHTVDTVVATYSITPARAAKVDFAGPYYTSGDAIQVKADNTSIKSVSDLDGKKIATESNSTAITAIKAKIKNANVQLFSDNDSCVTAVVQGRVDAYVLDQSILLSNAASNPQVKVVGQPFTTDSYGIGVPKDDPTAKQFVNKFLKAIEDGGQWDAMWKLCIGPYMQGNPPQPPAIQG